MDGVTSALAGKADKSSVPTKTSQLTNNSGFITNSVNNLSNYYTKSNTYTKTEVDNKLGVIGGITSATGVYTTAAWAIGSNTCIWNAPATGTYIVWMRYELQPDYLSHKNDYKQLQMHGSATTSVQVNLFWDDANGVNMINTISQPVTATQGQNITPYVHTPIAGVKFDVKIVALRIK